MQAPGHLNPELFKYPADQGRKYNDIKHWIFIAQKVEEAKFHSIFFADVLGGYDVYKAPAKLDPTTPAWSQFPINDPLYSILAMAAATESIVSALWEGSWRDDAVTAAAQGSYADPNRVREINHKSKYFNVPGPYIREPSPQRTPFLFQAGTSTAGRKFAAKHAEALFVNGHTTELVRPSVESIRTQAKEFGRDPCSLKIVAGSLVIVAETDEETQGKFEKLASYGDREGALALFRGWSRYDLGKYGDDEDFRFIDNAPPAVRSMVLH